MLNFRWQYRSIPIWNKDTALLIQSHISLLTSNVVSNIIKQTSQQATTRLLAILWHWVVQLDWLPIVQLEVICLLRRRQHVWNRLVQAQAFQIVACCTNQSLLWCQLTWRRFTSWQRCWQVIVTVQTGDFFDQISGNRNIPTTSWHSYSEFTVIQLIIEEQTVKDSWDFSLCDLSPQHMVHMGRRHLHNWCFVVKVLRNHTTFSHITTGDFSNQSCRVIQCRKRIFNVHTTFETRWCFWVQVLVTSSVADGLWLKDGTFQNDVRRLSSDFS